MAHHVNLSSGIEGRAVSDPTAAIDYMVERMEVSLAEAVASRGRASVVLSGGGTPKPVYERLTRFRGMESVEWVLGDERLRELVSQDSNLTMIAEVLCDLLDISYGLAFANPTTRQHSNQTVHPLLQLIWRFMTTSLNGASRIISAMLVKKVMVI